MLASFALSGCLAAQAIAPPPVAALRWKPAAPSLAAKAPGAPGYGLQFTTDAGLVMVTSLTFAPGTREASAKIFRIAGNAGLGPYRLGAEFAYHAKTPAPDNTLHPIFYDHYFYLGKIAPGMPAETAWPGGRWVVERVDGSNFGWDLAALAWHISNRPTLEIQAAQLPVFGGPSRKTIRIETRKVGPPSDPADGELLPLTSREDLKPWLQNPELWKELLILRSQQPSFAPLALELGGHQRWVVRAQGMAPGTWNLELWAEDPRSGAIDKGLVDVWPLDQDGLQAGRALKMGDAWYRITAYLTDPATSRLRSLDLAPWQAQVVALLGGATVAKDLGTLPTPALRESLEQLANEHLLEWKIRILPGQLEALDRPTAEDLVLRLEKGLLKVDLEGKGIRSRLDARTRAEAEHKAQTELAQQNQQAGPKALPQYVETERLADLMDQRKAILMAILGSAKQALAGLRR